MAITKIHLDQKTFDELSLGLSTLPLDTTPLRMHSLGKVVVVAGPNGAGKTRLLDLIKKLSSRVISPESEKELRGRRFDYTEHLSVHKELLKKTIANQVPQLFDEARQREIDRLNRTISDSAQELRNIANQLIISDILTISPPEPYSVIDFVPKHPALKDPSHVPDNTAKQRALTMRHAGSNNAEENAPAYCRLVMRSALGAFRQRLNTNSAEPTKEELAEKELLHLIESLLGPEIKVTLTDDLNLSMGTGDAYWAALSQGQQVLFQFACMLHAQGDSLSNAVVLMDEPENHLHPAVLNEVIDRLRESVGVGQVWVATHSVPLIAHLLASDPDCLWYADSGKFERAGRTPNLVLDGLMGGPKGAADLQALTLLPAEFAALKFLAECIMEPGVAGPDTNDPQTKQILEIISARARMLNRPLRVLDFGAGVGRLLTTLTAHIHQHCLKDFVDYYALEPDTAKHKELGQEIAAVYGKNPGERIFIDEFALNTLNPASVDVVVMCNVLHEIDPDNWVTLFEQRSPLSKAVSDEGNFLFVEDYGIPVGERAHRYGFILLDQTELRDLFDISEEDSQARRFIRFSSQEPKYKDRLVAHLIAKDCVTRISGKTRRQAIESLYRRTERDVAQYLESASGDQPSANGRVYARTAQLYANSAIWLRKHSAV